MVASSQERVNWRDFGGFLRQVRRRQGLSQERFAHLLGCHRTYLWRLEHGRNRPSSLFLHALLHSCNPTPQDVRLLATFIRMREYRLDCVEQEMDF